MTRTPSAPSTSSSAARPSSAAPAPPTTFVESALDEGRRYEQRVAQSLAGVVFQRVFPRLLQALADATDQPMPAIREAALIFLYRLLFVLYAEDRGLLPVNDAAYDDYGLRKRVRDDVARRKARNDTFSGVASSYYDHLTTLFRLIDVGDPSIGLPPYNGGLFAQNAAPNFSTRSASPTTSSPASSTTSATPRTTASPATSTTATCPSSNSAPSTNACSNRNPCWTPMAGSTSAPTPTPARTAAASTPRRTSWTSSSTRPSSP